MADHRMYLHKQRHRAPVETVDALGAVRDVESRIADVAELAEAVARRLRVSPGELREDPAGGRAARRRQARDPGEILSKPGSLGADEWEFVKRHPLIGERILAAAPDFGGAARLVRSSHERWDGTGYPDRLSRPRDPAGRADHLRSATRSTR